jgi:hypothetical protein
MPHALQVFGQILHGPWFVEVQSVGGAHEQRFTIDRSDSSDGSRPGDPGESVMVDGKEWFLIMEWFDGSDFQPSRVRRSAACDIDHGLTITLHADEGPGQGDGDFDDLVLSLRCRNPDINPPAPSAPPPSFTLPAGSVTGGPPPEPTSFR